LQPISLPKLSGLALVASLALAAPAAASGGFFCEGDGASLQLATGRLPVLAVIGAYAEAGGAAWTTGPERGEGTPFVVGQAFAEGDAVMVDFVDPNFEEILVSVRLRFEGNDPEWPLAGTIFANKKSWDVRCGGE
jgi:hypothetical protein